MEKINPIFFNHLSQMNQIKGQISENNLALIGSTQSNQIQFKDIMSQVFRISSRNLADFGVTQENLVNNN